MASPPITLADAGQIGRLGGIIPGVAAHSDLDPLRGAAQSHAVNRRGKEIIGDEFIEAFRVLVHEVKEHHPVVEFGAPADQIDGLEMPAVEFLKGLLDVRQGDDFLERLREKFRNQAHAKVRLACSLDHQGQLRGRLAHLHGRANVRVLRAVDQVRPVHQVIQVRGPEAKVSAGGLRDEFGAGAKIRSVEFLPVPVASEVLGIRFGEEGTLVMIEPPRQAVGAGILEIDDDVLFRIEQPLVKQLSGAVHQAVIAELPLRIDTLPVEAREDCCGAHPVETPIVKTHQNSHNS